MRSLFITKPQPASQSKPTATPFSNGHITPRETEILTLMAEGALNKQIASRLGISTETVKKHLRNIYQKTGAQNKIEALNKTRWLTASTPANQY
ncbi:response regulator transcription factor [Flavisolibacter ginsenosidimutans]|uniref:Response regulator transcription factor n=1 Tax=Flavisolibacter ginsenosidimutans TaxID=661481 RepID=A0A5B8UM00_9BACT|nr:LuxR C-terminal-related transcriptional regulator [Flavisolibacter ginsenosidimutans]QEC57055.1 response regulator transcription factor [Flavisolibacter ginsenosidimutans]